MKYKSSPKLGLCRVNWLQNWVYRYYTATKRLVDEIGSWRLVPKVFEQDGLNQVGVSEGFDKRKGQRPTRSLR